MMMWEGCAEGLWSGVHLQRRPRYKTDLSLFDSDEAIL